MKRLLFSSVFLLFELSVCSQTIGVSFGSFINSQSGIVDITPLKIPNLAYNWWDWDVFPNPGFSKSSETWLLVNSSNRLELGVSVLNHWRFVNFFKVSFQQFNFNAGYLTYAYDTRDSSQISPFIAYEFYVDYKLNYGLLSFGKQWAIKSTPNSKFSVRPTIAATLGVLLNQNVSVSQFSNMSKPISNASRWEELSEQFYFGGMCMINFTYEIYTNVSLEAGGFLNVVNTGATTTIEGYREYLDTLEYFGGPVYKAKSIQLQYGLQFGILYTMNQKKQKRNRRGIVQ